MEELLHNLEKRIKDLIDQHNKLKCSTQQFNQDKSLLLHEKTLLLARQKKAIAQIETLINSLKTIEKQL